MPSWWCQGELVALGPCNQGLLTSHRVKDLRNYVSRCFAIYSKKGSHLANLCTLYIFVPIIRKVSMCANVLCDFVFLVCSIGNFPLICFHQHVQQTIFCQLVLSRQICSNPFHNHPVMWLQYTQKAKKAFHLKFPYPWSH